jgi:hypothetical protein
MPAPWPKRQESGFARANKHAFRLHFLFTTTTRYIWLLSTFSTTSNRKEQNVATASVLSSPLSPKSCPRRRIGEVFGLSQLYGRIAGQRVAICCRSYYVSLLPTTATSEHLSPCSSAPVANKSKDTGRCYPHSGFVRDYNLTSRHLSASFVTAVAEAATPGDSLL